MRSYPENGWFHSAEFMRACAAIYAARGSLNFMQAKMFRCKYVQLSIDQRTGSFIFRDSEGTMLTHAEVYALFPLLEGDGALALGAPDDVDAFVDQLTKGMR